MSNARMSHLLFGLGVFAAFLSSGTARASCSGTISFGQQNGPCGGSAYCYVVSPGVSTTESILGSFWSLATGNPTVGAGDDNGFWQAQETWLQQYGSVSSITGTWSSSSAIDGCIAGRVPPGESSEVMVVGLSDTDALGKTGYFAVAAAGRHPGAFPEFDFAPGIGMDIDLVPIPTPRLLWSGHVFSFLPIRPEGVAPGFYSDGSATLTQAIRGYRIYHQNKFSWEAPPTDRRGSAWTETSPVVPLGQPWSGTMEFCTGEFDVTYFAVALAFDGGFETQHVSRDVRLNPCIPESVFDQDGDGWLPDDGGDCNDFDPTIHPGAPETNDGLDNQCGYEPGSGSIDEISGVTGFYHAADKTRLSWSSQYQASLYEVSRSDRPDFAGPCPTSTTIRTIWIDRDVPPSRGVFYYLVRAVAPHVGSWGTRSSGVERTNVCE